jgi:aminopeptidase
MLAIGEERAARISLAGPTTTGLLDDLDPERAGRDQLPFTREILKVIGDRTTNWTVVPCPTEPWARLVFPDLSPDDAFDRLWEQVAHVCRLDEPDPVAMWNERADALTAAAGRLNERGFDSLHFEGPGTDLTIGLLATSSFHAARDETVDGIVHLANLPTEEVYATPDPQRAEGHVRSTKPLVLADGTIIRGLRVRFEGGKAVEIDAEQGGGVMRARAAFDEGASRLGEVALVDREGRIGKLGTVFYDTLLDENAASHIALGDGSDEGLSAEDRERRNHSSIHIDFMIGGTRSRSPGSARTGAGRRCSSTAPQRICRRVRPRRGGRSSRARASGRRAWNQHLEPRDGAELSRGTKLATVVLDGAENRPHAHPLRADHRPLELLRDHAALGKPSVSAKPGEHRVDLDAAPRSCAAVATRKASWASSTPRTRLRRHRHRPGDGNHVDDVRRRG